MQGSRFKRRTTFGRLKQDYLDIKKDILRGTAMKEIKKVSLVIFDMDGLMFDTERIAISAWQKAGRDFGIHITSSIVIETLGLDINGTEKIFKKYFGNNFPFNDIRRLRVTYSQKIIEDNGIPVKNGLYDLIKFLEQKDIMKAVATSTERTRAERCLELAGLKNNFDIIVCGDEVSKGKPNPDIFLEVAIRLDCKTDESIVLEDSENGIIAASNAKMYPFLVPDIKRPSENVSKLVFKEFNSLIEVRDFLNKVVL